MMEAGDEYAELRGVMIRGRCEILEDEGSVRAVFEGRAAAQASPSDKVISWDHRKLGGRY